MILSAKKGKGVKMHIYADDVYFTTVTADFWYSGALKQNDEISDEDLAAFKEKADINRAYNKALDLISRRDHCKKELEDKIARTAGREAAKTAVQKAADAGLINDEVFSEKLADELFRRKGYSMNKIRLELIQKGIEREIAEQTVEKLDIDPRTRIIDMLETKFSHKTACEKDLARTINALVRLGYSYSDIRMALKECNIEMPDE